MVTLSQNKSFCWFQSDFNFMEADWPRLTWQFGEESALIGSPQHHNTCPPKTMWCMQQRNTQPLELDNQSNLLVFWGRSFTWRDSSDVTVCAGCQRVMSLFVCLFMLNQKMMSLFVCLCWMSLCVFVCLFVRDACGEAGQLPSLSVHEVACDDALIAIKGCDLRSFYALQKMKINGEHFSEC